jgi:hypothetical protein
MQVIFSQSAVKTSFAKKLFDIPRVIASVSAS